MRAVPSGTVGGRMPCAKTPWSSSDAERAIVVSASPMSTGMMWDVVVAVHVVAELAQAGAQACGVAGARRRGARARARRWSRRGAGGGDDGRRQRGGEDERARAVDQEIDQRAAAGHVGAEAAERLAERAHLHVDAPLEAERLDQSGAARARATPVACASSTITIASWRSARSQIAASGARVAVHAEDASR